MKPSVRPFARSRCLRAFSVLAWLMLVLGGTPVMAAPAHDAMAQMSKVAMAGMGDMHANRASHTHGHGDCCTGDAAQACHCASMCASVMPSVANLRMAIHLPDTYAASLPRTDAPMLDTSPPLRPPAIGFSPALFD
jgi:hypothetical protein